MATNLKNVKATALTSAITSVVSSGVKITGLTYAGSATAANPAGSETVTVNGSGFNNGATVYIDTTSCSTTYVSATSLTFTSPAKSVGTYHLYVYNTDGSTGILPAGFVSSSIPVWVTASGALASGQLSVSYSQSVSATGDGTITYSVTSGSLPTGLSLNTSTGAITGTPTVEATNNFIITASDSQNQTSSRSFSIQVLNVIVLDYLVVAGGGGGGRYGGGGGAGGLIYTTGANITPSSLLTITIGGGGTASDNAPGGIGGNSVISGSGFTTVTSVGGGGGGAGDMTGAATNGGSGGGGASDGTKTGGKGVYPGSTYLSQARQGYDGGTFVSNNNYMAGGGGAGAAGVSPSGAGAAGGVGLSVSITGASVYYAGGGGGGGWIGQGAGGNGGGGTGGAYNLPGVAGTTNTGGGGGGGYYDSNYRTGALGGSGVVILRFSSSVGVSATTGSPTITTDGSYKVYKFTASGSITF